VTVNSLSGYQIAVVAMVGVSVLVLLLYLRQRRSLEATRVEVAESARAELQAQFDSRTQEFAELARHLQTAREDERNRLARALHDELGALLTAAKLDAARIKTRVATVSPEALERLVHLNDTLNSIIALTRRITEDLRPSTLGNLGLVPALEILARDFAAGADIRIDCALEPVALNPHSQLTLFRLVQEALNNVAKYARAHRVQIALAPRDGQACVSVTDDGVGFKTVAGARVGSYGLLGMRYRIEGDGGRLVVQSAPGAGTCLSATLPLEVQASGRAAAV
jgi:signal transduction histidine kinase